MLIGGMGGFLVIALAVPDAYDGDGYFSDEQAVERAMHDALSQRS